MENILAESSRFKHLNVLPMMDLWSQMYNEVNYLNADDLNPNAEQGSLEHNLFNFALHLERVNEALINLNNNLTIIKDKTKI